MHILIASLPIILYLLAMLLGLFGVHLPGGADDLGPLAQWVLFLALGVTSLWSANAHAFATERVAGSIGWPASPFQKELAGANLGMGLGRSPLRSLVSQRPGRLSSWAQVSCGVALQPMSGT
jgi:amino acid transporter